MNLPIEVKVFKETNIDSRYKYYVQCQRCKENLTATLIWSNGKIETHPTFVGTRKFCDQCKREKQLELSKTKKSSRARKNPNCKDCGNPNPMGKHFCSDICVRNNSRKKQKLKREKKRNLRLAHTELSKLTEIEYYNDLVSKVSSYTELNKLDTMKRKRSYSWVAKYCKPNWMLCISDRIAKIKEEADIRNTNRLIEVNKLPYIKKVIKTYYNTENDFRIECECTNGHILKRGVLALLKQTECTICRSINVKNKKTIQKDLELERIQKQRQLNKEQTKLNKEIEYLKRVKMVSEFIQSGEYKNYDSWKGTPVAYEHSWLRNGAGIDYLTNELKERIDTISYFEYMSASTCPYSTKENHKWCRKCRTEQHDNDFRSAYICKECALKYRQDEYYEAGNIQGRINYHTNPMAKLHTLVKVYVSSALKGKPKSYRTKDILGMEWNEFRDYIESMFEPWMNWDNHGHGRGKWALQHIIPKTYAETEDDIYRLNYYKNLMPMDFSDNGALSDRILKYQLNEWHYDNCSDFLDKHKDSILESLDEINKRKIQNKIGQQ
jgi:hypothetical protein